MILAADIFDLIGNLLPMLLVVLVGLLTLIKRGLERLFGPPTPQRPRPPLAEELRRYIEVLEGQEALPKTRRERPPAAKPRPAVVLAPSAPPPPPTPEPPPPPPLGVAAELGVTFLDVREVAQELKAVQQQLDLTAADLRLAYHRAGERPAPRRVRLRTGARGLREGVLWNVVLGPPQALFLDPPGSLLPACRYL